MPLFDMNLSKLPVLHYLILILLFDLFGLAETKKTGWISTLVDWAVFITKNDYLSLEEIVRASSEFLDLNNYIIFWLL